MSFREHWSARGFGSWSGTEGPGSRIQTPELDTGRVLPKGAAHLLVNPKFTQAIIGKSFPTSPSFTSPSLSQNKQQSRVVTFENDFESNGSSPDSLTPIGTLPRVSRRSFDSSETSSHLITTITHSTHSRATTSTWVSSRAKKVLLPQLVAAHERTHPVSQRSVPCPHNHP